MSKKLFALIIALIGLYPGSFLSGNQATAQAAAAPAIQDNLILEGFNTLRNRKDPIRLNNGETLSGEKLAQFLLEKQIPVVWGSDSICSGSSCSKMYCSNAGVCSYEDGKPGIDPIYLNAGIKDQTSGQKSRLMRELAHEIYHRMQPFGKVKITQFEEYWAFYVDTQTVKANWPKFDGVDPLDPQQLEKWFKTHGLQGYLKLTPYPDGVAPIQRAD